MKKYSLLAFAISVCSLSFAQDDAIIIKGTGSAKITKDMTPTQVVDSLNKRFPDAKSVEYFKVPADAVAKGWHITEEDNLDPSATIDYYTITFKREDMKYYALYNPDGTLIKSRLEESSVTLPEPIKASLKDLKTQYPTYKLSSKTFYRNTDYGKKKEYYEIVAKDGKKQKRIFYNADGTIIKIKG
jgi:hypothetical protein